MSKRGVLARAMPGPRGFPRGSARANRSGQMEFLMHQTWKACLLLAAAVGMTVPSATADEPAGKSTSEPPGVELDDAAQPLVPVRPRSSGDEDRVRALALFAAARVAEQKQDYPRALRNYERALRFDPAAVPALREIVPLAFNLDRQAEAVRYALILAEREPTDPVLLRRLGSYLTEDGEPERALKFYEKAAALQAGEKPSANQVLLWMEIGRLDFVLKKYDQSAHYFGEVFKALERPAEYGLDATMQKALLGKAELTYQLIAESFLEAGRPAEALLAFEKSNQAKADEALRAYNLARIDAKQKQPAQALAKLETYFGTHSASQGTGPYHLFAELLKELGQSDQLLSRLEKIRSDDPDNMPLGYFLAQRYRQAGQLDKAEPIYAGLLERHKTRPPVEAFQGLLEIYRQQKDAAQLLLTLGEAVGRTSNLEPLGDAGKALLADTEMTKAVLANAAGQLEADPSKLSYGARVASGLVAAELKDFPAANTFFDLALKAEPSKAPEALVTWGLALFVANQFADAAKVFQRGLDEAVLPVNNPTLHFYLAGALEMAGRTDEAIVAARKAAELQPDSPRFGSRVAWIQYHAKRYEVARQSYQALIDKFDKVQDPADAREVLRDARLVLSNLCVIEGKLSESEEWLEQVLDEFPEDIGALNDLGYVWADAGKHLERALQMIQRAVGHEPKNMAYRDSLGWVLFRLGRFPEAIAELKAAAAVEEPDGVILDHLGEALYKSGDTAAAVDAWSRAAQSFEKHADTEKAKPILDKISRAQNPPVKN
ncbi:MAG: tetratricopeptide repeat protein [Planctomycetia bacterium]|nr:tetratricopeptide repeat protein [Planctomycetia bacterium]